MPDLLLELFSEEIPARMQRKAAGDLRKAITDGLVDAGLTYEGCKEHWTPRRLTLDLRGLTARSADVREERKGPRVDAPEKAIEGFLRGAGLSSVDEAQVRNDPKKGDFYVAIIEKSGRAAEEVIAELVPQVIRNFPWPKSQRWGSGTLKWVRPLRAILCTFGPETEEPEVINFEVDGIKSGNVTYGHRFMAPDAIKVKRFDDYAASLESAKVMLDAERRKETIATDAQNLAFAQGLELVDDAGLLEEVSSLVEWPVTLMGTFEDAFLDIPDEAIRLTIKENQKCFVVRDKAGNLSNKFILVSNIEASDGGAEVVRGNEKVVNARLSDAKFFWETDLAQVTGEAGFAPWIEKLDAVTFHAKLGTQGERVQRIKALARELAAITGADADRAERAAEIAKADLNSAMVYEFPDLQGMMGRIYATRAGEHASVALAAEDHYKPQGPSDDVPRDPVAVTVALADKLDLLTGFWAIDEKPTGSKDPFALRRAALGVIRLVMENDLRLGLKSALTLHIRVRVQSGLRHLQPTFDNLLSFFHDRLIVWMKDQGARDDVIKAVLAAEALSPLGGEMSGETRKRGVSEGGVDPSLSAAQRSLRKEERAVSGNDDLLMVARRVEAVTAFLNDGEGENLTAGLKRGANILAAEAMKGTEIADGVDTKLFKQDEEKTLAMAVAKASSEVPKLIDAEDFNGALKALAGLRAPVDAFFEGVMVNDEDPAIRANRLALLSSLRDAASQIADFSLLQG